MKNGKSASVLRICVELVSLCLIDEWSMIKSATGYNWRASKYHPCNPLMLLICANDV